MIDQAAYLLELDKMSLPTVNYHYLTNLGLSSVNFFGLAFGLYMLSAPMMGWIEYESPTLATCLMFGGICQYLIGFYDWYMGRTMLSFLDFMYGLLHLVYYYTADLGKYSIWVPNEYHTYMQGVFYILWFVILCFTIFGIKDRGCLHLIYTFLLALATIFLFVWEFSRKTWERKVAGYMFFVSSVLIWIAGFGRLLSSVYHCDKAPMCVPYL